MELDVNETLQVGWHCLTDVQKLITDHNGDV